MNDETKNLLESVRRGEVSVDEAYLKLRTAPFRDLGFAKIDTHRRLRTGAAEVIYGAGKTPEQMLEIIKAMLESGQETILITRLEKYAAEILNREFALSYCEIAKIGSIGSIPEPSGNGCVVVAAGGTSDIPVAEEAALTAEFHGSRVLRLYDVGVAGLHRLLSHIDEIMGASVIIAVAGMEGALASVIGGLADCPVIAVPTSVGYGAAFGGVAALLSMLNSCSSGVSVVNIDLGVHMIDLAIWLMGNPRAVAVSGCTFCKFANDTAESDSVHSQFGEAVENGTFDVEDLAMGFIKFENGACLQIEFSWASNIESENRFVELRGEKAGCKWWNGESAHIYTEEEGHAKDIHLTYSPCKNGHAANLEHFVDVVLNGTTPDFVPAQGVNMIKILNAMYESAKTGKEVRLD